MAGILHILLGMGGRYKGLANVKEEETKTTQEPIITPNKWQSQHYEYEISNAGQNRLYRVTNQTPLDYLYKRKVLMIANIKPATNT